MTIPEKRDPSKAPCTCESCGKEVTVETSVSFIMLMATTGYSNLPCIQCPAEQHFACSINCAAALAHTCIEEHLKPMHALRVEEKLTSEK